MLHESNKRTLQSKTQRQEKARNVKFCLLTKGNDMDACL